MALGDCVAQVSLNACLQGQCSPAEHYPTALGAQYQDVLRGDDPQLTIDLNKDRLKSCTAALADHAATGDALVCTVYAFVAVDNAHCTSSLCNPTVLQALFSSTYVDPVSRRLVHLVRP